jgi:hypothetical protein
VPGIEEIQDLVEVGLVELGRAAVAKAYILYRDRRNRARDSMALAAQNEAAPAVLRSLRVREAQGSFPWSKGRIIAALVQEADLSREQAQEVAGRVEARVVASELKRISTALIRELVDNELVAMGLSGALLRQAPVSIPRHDLRELLERGERSQLLRGVQERPAARAGLDARQALGGELLSRYALTDVLDEASAELHLSGALQVEDLRAPHLHLSQALGAGLLLRGAPGARAAFDALEEIAELFGSVSRGVVLEAPGALLQPLQKPQEAEGLRAWLLALGALARAARRRVDLAAFGSKGAPLGVRLVEELDDLHELAEHSSLPRLFLGRGELQVLLGEANALQRGRVERLLQRGALVPTWAPKGERSLGPAGLRTAREQGGLICGGAVALNLVRLARQAGPWREDLLLEGLAHLIEQAVEALAQLARFQRSVRSARSGEARGRVAYALAPVGLREALRLVGDGELRAEQGARLLGLCSEAGRRYAAQRGLSLHLSSHFGAAAAARFAEVDSGGRRVRQGLLFEGPGGASAPEAARSYGRGFALGPLPGQVPGRAQAQLLATVPAGSWSALELDRSAGDRPQLEAFELFARERETIRQGVPSAAEVPRGATIFPLGSPSPRAS